MSANGLVAMGFALLGLPWALLALWAWRRRAAAARRARRRRDLALVLKLRGQRARRNEGRHA
jgi:hypothetical protein